MPDPTRPQGTGGSAPVEKCGELASTIALAAGAAGGKRVAGPGRRSPILDSGGTAWRGGHPVRRTVRADDRGQRSPCGAAPYQGRPRSPAHRCRARPAAGGHRICPCYRGPRQHADCPRARRVCRRFGRRIATARPRAGPPRDRCVREQAAHRDRPLSRDRNDHPVERRTRGRRSVLGHAGNRRPHADDRIDQAWRGSRQAVHSGGCRQQLQRAESIDRRPISRRCQAQLQRARPQSAVV